VLDKDDFATVSIAYVVPQPELTLFQVQVGKKVHWKKEQLALLKTEINNETKPDQLPEKLPEKKPPSPVSDLPVLSNEEEDRVLNYSLQILQLGTLLMQLNDTEKEGDGERSIRNMKLLMLYFRSRSRGMKYAYEILRFVTCVKALYTHKTAHKITHGQFVNWKGGAGRNVANDLKQEHLVKYNKTILKGLAGNKTLKAVERATKASFGIKNITENFDQEGSIQPDSTAHTSATKKDDEREMITIIDTLKPFRFTAGRKHNSFKTISKSSLDQLDVIKLDAWMTKHKKRLARNYVYLCEDFNDEEGYLEEVSNDLEENSTDM